MSGATKLHFTEGEIVPGITITSASLPYSSLTVNTIDTSIIGFECTGGFIQQNTQNNLTIYGMSIILYNLTMCFRNIIVWNSLRSSTQENASETTP